MEANKQYMNFLSAYYHFMSVIMADDVVLEDKEINVIYNNDKFKKLDDTERGYWRIGELDKIVKMLYLAQDIEPNLYLSKQIGIINNRIGNGIINGEISNKSKVIINDAFLKGVESFKFDEFMKCMNLDRKKFEIRNASELNNYCEIYCVDREIYSNDHMIWCGDFISRKKLGQRTIKDFHFSVDGDYFVARYLTNLWHKYNEDLHKAINNEDLPVTPDYGKECVDRILSRTKIKMSRAERRALKKRRKREQISE